MFPLNGHPYDEEVTPGARRNVTTCKWGLQVTINLDWYISCNLICASETDHKIMFRVTDNWPHPVGGFYASFNSLYQGVRFLQHNVALIMAIPGPFELSLENLNHIFEPWVNCFHKVYKGKYTVIFNFFDLIWPLYRTSYGYWWISNTPADI